MNYIKYLKNAGTIAYANESRMPGYGPGHWYGGLVSGINGSRYSVHPGVYNFYTNEDGSISWGKRTGHIIKGSDGKQYVDFEVDPNLTARPELKTYLRFELGLTALKPQTPISELTTEQKIINPTLGKVSTSVPILNLASLENPLPIILQLPVSKPIPTKSNTVTKLPALKPVTTKSTPIVKLPIPLNLLPYIANVTSDGVAFFNIPEGYDSYLFRKAIEAVYLLNKELAQKPMVYYELPRLLILQLKQQLQAVLLSLRLYQAQRLLIALRKNIKYNTDNNTQIDKELAENNNDPDLVTEVFAYPSRLVDVYNIHPEAYLKVLEYLNNNFKKTKTNNKQEKYVLSLSGFGKVPIGGEVNDSTFHYIGKNGDDRMIPMPYYRNPNIISKNEIVSRGNILLNINTDNGKLKMYSRSNDNSLYYKGINTGLLKHSFPWMTYNKLNNNVNRIINDLYYPLKKDGLTDLQIIDYANKYTTFYTDYDDYDVDKSIFHPIEKKLTTLNNSTGNIVLKAKLKAKQAGKKVLSFLGFLNGGQLNYLNYMK